MTKTKVLEHKIPNIIYYNDEIHHSHKCTKELSRMLSVTWTMPNNWNDLVAEVENGGEFLAFHIDMISKSKNTSII